MDLIKITDTQFICSDVVIAYATDEEIMKLRKIAKNIVKRKALANAANISKSGNPVIQ